MARKSTTGRAKVRLHRHQAGSGGEPVNAFDLNTVQDNVQKALDQIQLSCECSDSSGGGGGPLGAGVVFDYNVNAAANINGSKLADNSVSSSKIISLDGSKLVAGSVATAALANGSVTSAKIADGTIATVDIGAGQITQALLENFLRSACKYTVSGTALFGSGAAIPFATKVFDPFTQVVTTTINPVASGVVHWDVALRLTGGDVNAGRSAFIQVIDTTTSTVVATGQPCGGFTDVSTGLDTIVARLNEAFPVTAGHIYNVTFQLLIHPPGVYTGWSGSANVQSTGQTVTYTQISSGVHTTYQISGSYLQLLPVAQ